MIEITDVFHLSIGRTCYVIRFPVETPVFKVGQEIVDTKGNRFTIISVSMPTRCFGPEDWLTASLMLKNTDGIEACKGGIDIVSS